MIFLWIYFIIYHVLWHFMNIDTFINNREWSKKFTSIISEICSIFYYLLVTYKWRFVLLFMNANYVKFLRQIARGWLKDHAFITQVRARQVVDWITLPLNTILKTISWFRTLKESSRKGILREIFTGYIDCQAMRCYFSKVTRLIKEKYFK